MIVCTIPLLWLLSDQLSSLFSVAPYVSACYPANGIIVGYFLVFGCRFTPYLTAIVITHIIYWQMGQFSTVFDFIQGIRHQIVYGGMGMILFSYFRISVPFARVRDIGLFVMGSIVATLTSAIAAAASFYGYHLTDHEHIFALVTSFWIGDLTGLVVFCPIIIQVLLWMRRHLLDSESLTGRPLMFDLRLDQVVIATVALIIVKVLPDIFSLKENAVLLMVIPITFVALQSGYLAAITITAYINILMGLSNHLFFSPLAANDLQMLMLTTGISGLFVGILSEEGRRSGSALQQLARQNHLLAAAAQASPTPMSVIDTDQQEIPICS
ncbi:MAG: MASE1 domain-containing protein [Rhodospirillaceae bacterium]